MNINIDEFLYIEAILDDLDGRSKLARAPGIGGETSKTPQVEIFRTPCTSRTKYNFDGQFDENDEYHFRPLHDVVALLVVLEQSDRGQRVERDHTPSGSKLKRHPKMAKIKIFGSSQS